jgi:hypothetical protein
MEEIKNKYARTMLVEAKYSLISKGFPIKEDKKEVELLNFDTFKIALKEKIENLKIKNRELLENLG